MVVEMHLRGKVLADIYDDERGRRGGEERRENGMGGMEVWMWVTEKESWVRLQA
jgi:hypothetical protein